MISVLLFGFLWWSSSWWWWPHIAGCKMFVSLLRAGLTDLVQFFCKMYFVWVSWSHEKNLVQFFWFYPPKWQFFPRGGTWPAKLPELRALPSILAKCSLKKLHSSLVEVSGCPLCWNWGQCPHFWQTAEHGSFQLMAIISNWYSDTMNSSWMVVQWIPYVSTFHINGVVNITDWTNMP